MTFARPTLAELKARTLSDFETQLGTGPLPSRSSGLKLSAVQALLSHTLHGHLDFIANQIPPHLAEIEGLVAWGELYRITRLAATASTGTATFTGTTGTVIPAGTLVQRSDGTQYSTDASATLVGGTVSTAITAVVPGEAGDAATSTSLTLVTAIAGLDSAATVDSPGLGGGSDTESDAALRTRVIERLQTPPQGGAVADYVQWARLVTGVTRVFVEEGSSSTGFGLGTVSVTFTTDEDPAGPIPDSVKVAEVQASIDALKPVGPAVTVFAPTAVNLDLTIQLTPNNATVQAAVKASLEDMLRAEAKPGTTLSLSKIREAVSTAAGEESHTLQSPTADVVTTTAELLVLGTITFV